MLKYGTVKNGVSNNEAIDAESVAADVEDIDF